MDIIDILMAKMLSGGSGGDPEAIASAVTGWLEENVDPVGSAVVVDSSLSIEGAAADAKATGDAMFEKIDMPSGGQSGQALLSDGNDGAYWGTVQTTIPFVATVTDGVIEIQDLTLATNVAEVGA